MFFSLVQTLVCVLLINGSLYALHLTGGGGSVSSSSDLLQNSAGLNAPSLSSNSGSSSSSSANSFTQQHMLHDGSSALGLSLKKPAVSSLEQSGQHRLTEELADMAQLERERLMLLGLAKQTAAANTGGTGHNGRPIITGRIQMTPAEDVEGDYPGYLVQQQARGFMFGNVVQHPTLTSDDYDSEEEFDGGGGGGGRGGDAIGAAADIDVNPSARRHPVKYEYGRIVTPADREYESQNIDLDSYMELDSDPDVEDIIPDLDGYQYLDELLAEEQELQQQKQRHKDWNDQQAAATFSHVGHKPLQQQQHQQQPHSYGSHFQHPYQTLEELEINPPPLTLQELFEKEAIQHRHQQQLLHQQQQQQQQQHQQNASGLKNRNGLNIRMQQKWQRKRSQMKRQQQLAPPEQQQQYQRNIFGHQRQPQQQHQQQKQKQQHHFMLPQAHTKLSLANSEATATKHIGKSMLPMAPSDAVAAAAAAGSAMKSSSASSSSSASEATASLRSAVAANAAQKNTPMNLKALEQQSSSAGVNGGKSSTQEQQQQQLKQQQQQQREQLLQHSTNRKRSSGGGSSLSAASGGGYAVGNGMQSPVTHSIASQLMLRTARGQRQYDVPQIECPTAMDGMERFACPTPDLQGRYRCIDDHVLCDGFIDCPEGEDEDRRSCMFYKTTKAHLDVLADALLRWARGR